MSVTSASAAPAPTASGNEEHRRDHRRLGPELDLFSFPDEIGSGLAVFHPKGGIVRRELEDHSRRRHQEEDYDFVHTPHITKETLLSLCGPLEWYRDSMYPAMHLDADSDRHDGTADTADTAGADYFLKPMNCPFHNLIYRSRGRSYRELPLRLFEFGTVYRNEKPEAVHGLTSVRGMTQDDTHVFCTPEQLHDELGSLLGFVLGLLRDYGLDDFHLELSTRDDTPDHYVGSVADWDRATGRGAPPPPPPPAPPACRWRPTATARSSTARASRSTSTTPSAGRGSCQRSRSTSICRSASGSSTPPRTAADSAR